MRYTDNELSVIEEVKIIFTEAFNKLKDPEFSHDDCIMYLNEEIQKFDEDVFVSRITYNTNGDFNVCITFKETQNEFEYELKSGVSDIELDSKLKQMIESCEPWRNTSPELSAHEDILRESCNNDSAFELQSDKVAMLILKSTALVIAGILVFSVITSL